MNLSKVKPLLIIIGECLFLGGIVIIDTLILSVGVPYYLTVELARGFKRAIDLEVELINHAIDMIEKQKKSIKTLYKEYKK